jgi:hypothetical protein
MKKTLEDVCCLNGNEPIETQGPRMISSHGMAGSMTAVILLAVGTAFFREYIIKALTSVVQPRQVEQALPESRQVAEIQSLKEPDHFEGLMAWLQASETQPGWYGTQNARICRDICRAKAAAKAKGEVISEKPAINRRHNTAWFKRVTTANDKVAPKVEESKPSKVKVFSSFEELPIDLIPA